MMARAVPEWPTMLLGLERQTGRDRGAARVRAPYRDGREVAGTRTAFSQSCPQFPPAAGIKHLRRLRGTHHRRDQAPPAASRNAPPPESSTFGGYNRAECGELKPEPARCCLQGVRTRQGISRIHHRCFGSVAASLESKASLLQVSRNSVDQEQNKRFSFQVSRNSAD